MFIPRCYSLVLAILKNDTVFYSLLYVPPPPLSFHYNLSVEDPRPIVLQCGNWILRCRDRIEYGSLPLASLRVVFGKTIGGRSKSGCVSFSDC